MVADLSRSRSRHDVSAGSTAPSRSWSSTASALGQCLQVLAFHRCPEPRLGLGADTVPARHRAARNRQLDRFRPYSLALERVRRQVHALSAAQHGRPVHLWSAHVYLGESRQHPPRPGVFSVQRPGHRDLGVRVGILDGLGDRRGQHRMRGYLDERPIALAGQLTHRVGEPDGLPHVVIPVPGVQLGPVHPPAVHRGEQADLSGLRPQPGQLGGQRPGQLINPQ